MAVLKYKLITFDRMRKRWCQVGLGVEWNGNEIKREEKIVVIPACPSTLREIHKDYKAASQDGASICTQSASEIPIPPSISIQSHLCSSLAPGQKTLDKSIKVAPLFKLYGSHNILCPFWTSALLKKVVLSADEIWHVTKIVQFKIYKLNSFNLS